MKVYLSKVKSGRSGLWQQRSFAGRCRHPAESVLQLSLMLRDPVQAKLKIGKPNDRYEQEADRVADRVMSASESSHVAAPVAGSITPLTVQRAEEEEAQTLPLQRQEEEEGAAQPKLQRQPEEEEEAQPMLQRQEEEEEEMQMKPAGNVVAPKHFAAQMSRVRDSGQPLPVSERAFFEPRFGTDFSGVRVHSGGQAAEMSRNVQARAFTVGNDLVFGAGQYEPGSVKGRKLLAHELTHVVQQSGGD